MDKEFKASCKNILKLVGDLVFESNQKKVIILKLVDVVRNLQKDIETDFDLMNTKKDIKTEFDLMDVKRDLDLEAGYDTVY